jgi:toxin HigB-1
MIDETRIRHSGLAELFLEGRTAKIGANLQKNCMDILRILNMAVTLNDLNNAKGFHSLTGDRKNEFSMKVSANWRITFTYINNKFSYLNLEDYHN